MKNFYNSTKLDRRTEERVRRIVDLSRRRDSILEVSQIDLEALVELAVDYAAANSYRMRSQLLNVICILHPIANPTLCA